MPGITMNLHASISRDSSSSAAGSSRDNTGNPDSSRNAHMGWFPGSKLEAAQQRIPLRYLEFLPKDGNVHELFIRTKGFRHKNSGFRRLATLLGTTLGVPESRMYLPTTGENRLTTLTGKALPACLLYQSSLTRALARLHSFVKSAFLCAKGGY
jgi:hypothetical protein